MSRGEISTIIILSTFAVLAVATLVTTTLNREVQTTETQAASESCPLIGNPQLISGGKCQVSTNASKSLVCALIDPSRPAGSQLVAGQDPESGPLDVNWSISGGIGTVQLYKEPSISINTDAQYRVVAYNWKDPTNCVKQTDIPGSTAISLFGGGNTDGDGDAPTNTPAPTSPSINQPTNSPAPKPSQCASPEVWCATLNRCAGRTSCPTPTPTPNTTDGRCTYIGDVDCITLTPKPTNTIYLPIVQNNGANTPTPIPGNQNASFTTTTINTTDEVYLPACDGSGNYSACFKIDSNSI